MMKADCLIDTSSAILLHRADLLPIVLEQYNVGIRKSVHEELVKPNYEGALNIREYINLGSLSIMDYNDNDTISISDLRHLGKGEKDTIKCCIQGYCKFIILDDGKGARYCMKRNIPFINALLIPRILYLTRIIGFGRYEEKMSYLSKIGWYSDSVIGFAYKMNINELEYFLPEAT